MALVLERTTLDGQIYETLRKRIVALELPPGSMIFENSVADEFGVSRTPVRHAFSRLAADELLRVIPQRGAQVSRLSAAKFREAQYVREALELSAWADIARIWNREADHRAIEQRAYALIDQQRQVVATQDYVGFTQLDAEFHDTIIGVLGNTTLITVLQSLRVHLSRVRYLELQEAHHEHEAIADHVTLMDAITTNNVEAATKGILAHLKMLESMREEIFARHSSIFE